MAKSTKKWAIGAMIAGVAGYVAGLLTAPKSGKETRTDIKHAANKAKTEAEKKIKELHSDLDKLIADAKNKGTALTGKAKEEYKVALEKAISAKEKAREVLSTLHDGDADDPELKQAVKEIKDAFTHLKKYVKS